MKRDGAKCQHCGAKENLNIHHLTYDHIFNETNHLADLITLCNDCHRKEHGLK